MIRTGLVGVAWVTLVAGGLASLGCGGGSEKGTTGAAGTSAQGGSGGSTGGESTGGSSTGGVSSGGSTSTGTSTWSEAEKKEACEAYGVAGCDKSQECLPLQIELAFGDLATCKERAALSGYCYLLLSLADGPSPSDFKSCAEAINALSCDGYPYTLPPECEALNKGSRLDGEPCAGGPQCTGGRCVKANGGSICGVCGQPVKAGEACSLPMDCAAPLRCSQKTGLCEAVPDMAGAPCDLQSYPACKMPLVCNPVAPSQCLVPQPLGASCNGKDLICNGSVLEQCNLSTKVCEPTKAAAPGETCGADQATGTVVLCKGAVNGCSNLAGNGTCAAPVPDGGMCTSSNQCLIGAICDKGICTIPPPPVAPICN